jgi:hypothetical protein
MSARKPSTLIEAEPSNLRSQPVRIPASGCEERKCGAHAEDRKFQPADDLRLAICENRRIGTSLHREGHGVGFRWPDDPMVRSLGSPGCVRNKRSSLFRVKISQSSISFK